uniref:(California timema) hypothetical protein n=1 Tax=Timema californicum TaxID=61474 RepID=A0A7R9P7Z1_TIMCA|nr:unnamed protein product [Timema californicum]
MRRGVENININISLVLEKTDVSKRMILPQDGSYSAINGFRDPYVLVGTEGYVASQMSSAKTTFMLFKGKIVRNPAIKVEEKNLIQTVRYLGVTLDENINFPAHIEEVMGRFHMPMQIIKTYHHAVLLSIVGYGVCVWAHRLNNVVPARAVRNIQRNVFLGLRGTYQTVATDALSVTLGVWPLVLLVTKRAIGYLKRKNNWEKVKILTSPEVETSEDVVFSLLREWQRRWEGSETGRRGYQLFPNVVERIDNAHLEPSPVLVQFITGKGPYPESLRKMGLVETDRCECGEVGIPEYVVLECARTLEIRPNQQEVRERPVGGSFRKSQDGIYKGTKRETRTETKAKQTEIQRRKGEGGERPVSDNDEDNERYEDRNTGSGTEGKETGRMREPCDCKSLFVETKRVRLCLVRALCVKMEIGGCSATPLYHRGNGYSRRLPLQKQPNSTSSLSVGTLEKDTYLFAQFKARVAGESQPQPLLHFDLEHHLPHLVQRAPLRQLWGWVQDMPQTTCHIQQAQQHSAPVRQQLWPPEHALGPELQLAVKLESAAAGAPYVHPEAPASCACQEVHLMKVDLTNSINHILIFKCDEAKASVTFGLLVHQHNGFFYLAKLTEHLNDLVPMFKNSNSLTECSHFNLEPVCLMYPCLYLGDTTCCILSEFSTSSKVVPVLTTVTRLTCVTGSFMMRTSVTGPNMPKYSLSFSDVVCQLSPPTNNFPGAGSPPLGVLPICFLVVSSAVAYSAFVVYQFATRDIQKEGGCTKSSVREFRRRGNGNVPLFAILSAVHLPILYDNGACARDKRPQSSIRAINPLPPGDIGERGSRAGGRAHTQEGGQGIGRTSEDTPGAQNSSWLCILVVSRLTRGKPRWYSQIWEPHNTKVSTTTPQCSRAPPLVLTGGRVAVSRGCSSEAPQSVYSSRCGQHATVTIVTGGWDIVLSQQY